MKKSFLTYTAIIAGTLIGSAQATVGILEADPSAALHVEASNMGVLIPRVELTATNLKGPITAPTVANSLLVYNTGTAGAGSTAVSPGFYYWNTTDSMWHKIADDSNLSTLVNGQDATSDTSITLTNATKATLTALDIKVAALGIKEGHIADDAVTTAKILDSNVTPLKIDAALAGTGLARSAAGVLSVDATTITGDSDITSDDLTVGGTANALLEGVTLEIAAGKVGTTELADDAVTTVKILDNNVTVEKIAESATDGQVLTTVLGETVWADASTSSVVQTATTNDDAAVTATTAHTIATHSVVGVATPVTINETVTKIAQDNTTGIITFTDENAQTDDTVNTAEELNVVSVDAFNASLVGADGGAYVSNALAIKTASYTVVKTDQMILADASSSAITISLPDGADAYDGMTIGVEKIDSSNNIVTITATAIHDAGLDNSINISLAYTNFKFRYFGGTWYVVGGRF